MALASSSKDARRGKRDDGAAVGRRPMPRNALPCTSKRIAHVELFRPRTIIGPSPGGGSPPALDHADEANDGKRRHHRAGRTGPPLKKYHLLFLALYLHQLYWICSTVGVPYREFLDKAEREGFEGECWQSRGLFVALDY
jgi:hypothetical protein